VSRLAGIETFYNSVRLHQTLGYLSPNDYEAENAPVLAAWFFGPDAVRKCWATAVLRKQLLDGGDLLEPTRDDISQAWIDYRNGKANQAGIVDHLSFAVMRRHGLVRAFSNDQYFRAAGFETLF